MLCEKHPPIRNLIDLSDPRQVRTLKRRLGVSGADFRRIIEKAGTSIAAITKEVELEKRWCLPKATARLLRSHRTSAAARLGTKTSRP